MAARVRELLRAADGEVGPDPDLPAAPARSVPLVPPPLPLPAMPSLRQRLAARVPVRLDPGRRAAVGVGLAVAIAAVLTAVWLAAQRPHSLAVPSAPSSIAGAVSPAGSGRAAAPPTSGTTGAPPGVVPTDVVVDVAGKVRRPGLYRLPSGSRVDDAVRRAGGALRGVDLSSLNLAARVVDGQQILVGVPGAARVGPVATGTAAQGAPGTAGAPVSLNSASLEELEALPGVGPVLAQHILDWRTAHGGFASVAQLNDVPGIGEVKFAALRSLVTT